MKNPRHFLIPLGFLLSACALLFLSDRAVAVSFTGEYFSIANGAPETGGSITGLQTGLLSSSSLVAGFPAFPHNFWSTSASPQVTKDDLNASFYRAVHWSSLFSTSGPVTFSLQADDHTWLFVDGVLQVDDGGVKSISVPAQTSGALVLGAGAHTLDLFFADARTSQSGVVLACAGCADPVSDAPEPTSLLLFGTTLFGLGAAIRRRLRRRRKNSSPRMRPEASPLVTGRGG